MKHTMPGQSVRIAGLLFAGTAALIAQSPASKEAPAKVDLIALNTPKTITFPSSAATLPAPPAQAAPSGKNAPSETTTQTQAQAQASDLIKKVLAAPAPAVTAVPAPATRSHSWFTTGTDAFPLSVRMDPAFGLPPSQYGAGPAAVAFSFGRK